MDNVRDFAFAQSDFRQTPNGTKTFFGFTLRLLKDDFRTPVIAELKKTFT